MNWEAIGAVGEIVDAIAVVSRYESIIAALFATPGGHRFWQGVKHFLAGRQAQALEALIARGQLPDIRRVFLMDSAGDKATEGAPEGSN